MASSQLAWRFVAGGSVVVIVSWLARGKHPLLAGLFVLFPAVTLVSFYFLAQNASPDTMRRIALFSIYSLPTTLAFLATFYLSQHRMSSIFGLCAAVASWLLVAIVLVALNARVFHI